MSEAVERLEAEHQADLAQVRALAAVVDLPSLVLLKPPARRWEQSPAKAVCKTCGWACIGPVGWVDQAVCNEANGCGNDEPCMFWQEFV